MQLLTEAAWYHRHGQTTGKALNKLREGRNQWAIEIADRDWLCLRKRYYRFVNRGKPPCKATTAMARDLAGFIWSALIEYEACKKRKVA